VLGHGAPARPHRAVLEPVHDAVGQVRQPLAHGNVRLLQVLPQRQAAHGAVLVRQLRVLGVLGRHDEHRCRVGRGCSVQVLRARAGVCVCVCGGGCVCAVSTATVSVHTGRPPRRHREALHHNTARCAAASTAVQLRGAAAVHTRQHTSVRKGLPCRYSSFCDAGDAAMTCVRVTASRVRGQVSNHWVVAQRQHALQQVACTSTQHQGVGVGWGPQAAQPPPPSAQHAPAGCRGWVAAATGTRCGCG
jgi:hypothetical protein